MTGWQDPPLTRREARERERRAAREAAERAGAPTTAAPTGESQSDAAPTPPAQPHHSHRAQSAPDEPPDAAAGNASEADLATEELERTLPGRLDHRARMEEHPEYYRTNHPEQSAGPVTMPVSLLREATERGATPPARQDVTPEGETPAARPPAAQPPAAQPTSAVPERTLTRRELRAMLQAQEANERVHDDDREAVVEREEAVSWAPPVTSRGTAASEFASPPVAPPPQEGGADAVSVESRGATPSRRSGPVAFDDLVGQQSDTGGSSTASSALILPSVPKAPDATGPLTATGEILVTGTIDLPRSLGATGQHPDRYDSAEMDRLFDAEADPRTSDVEPVRASRAVSSHTGSPGMITPPQKKDSKLAVVLPVTAAVLAVAVIGLVIAGFVFNVF